MLNAHIEFGNQSYCLPTRLTKNREKIREKSQSEKKSANK